MGWFSDDSDQAYAYQQYGETPPHEASLTHEILGAAVAFEAAKAYENHCAENGRPDDHATAKEVLAGISGFILDREIETKGLDFIDRERAEYEVNKHLDEQLRNEY